MIRELFGWCKSVVGASRFTAENVRAPSSDRRIAHPRPGRAGEKIGNPPPAALLYHRPEGSTQVVDLVVCGSDRPIRSVTLPAP